MNKVQNEKAIITAWSEYQNDDGGATMPSENFEKGFAAGAEWRINSVWHDASEEPIKERGRWLAFCGGVKVFLCEEWHGQFLWSGYVSMLSIITWAYINDLLPERKEEL